MIIRILLLISCLPLLSSSINNNDLTDVFSRWKGMAGEEFETLIETGWVMHLSVSEIGATLRIIGAHEEKFEFEDEFIDTDARIIRLNGRLLGTIKTIKSEVTGERRTLFDKIPVENCLMGNGPCSLMHHPNALEELLKKVDEALERETALAGEAEPGPGSSRPLVMHKIFSRHSGIEEGRLSGSTAGVSSGRLVNCVSCALGILGYASEILAIATAPETLGAGAALALATHPGTVAAIALNCPKALGGKP